MKTILVIFLFVFCFSCSSQKTNKNIELVDQLLTELAAKEQFNGGVLIAEKNKIVFNKSYGYADFESTKKLNEQTVFQTASISKTFTAVAVIQLIEQKKLSLEDKLTDFFPDLPYSEVKIKHLLNHTSGLYPYNPLFKNNWDFTKIAENSDIVEMYEKEQPEPFFEAGAEFSYCNVGYVFLSCIVEKISGLSFSEYLRQHIFAPLKMNNTQTYTLLNQPRIENFAHEYLLDPLTGETKKVQDLAYHKEVYYLNGKLGDDKVATTLEDAWKWNRALFENNFIPLGFQKMAFNSSIAAIPKDKRHSRFDFGNGFQLDSLDAYGKIIYHNGGEPGLKARFYYYPDIDLTIIMYANAYVKYIDKIKDVIFALLTSQDYELPKKSITDEVIKNINQSDLAISKMIEQYQKDTVNYYLSESELDKLAGIFWEEEQFSEGLKILKLNVKYFPKSINATYTLGEGYMETGKMEDAVGYFKKAKELILAKPEEERNTRFLDYLNYLIEENMVEN